MVSCEFCEISKNTFFTEHLWTTDSHRMDLQDLSAKKGFFDILKLRLDFLHFQRAKEFFLMAKDNLVKFGADLQRRSGFSASKRMFNILLSDWFLKKCPFRILFSLLGTFQCFYLRYTVQKMKFSIMDSSLNVTKSRYT